MAITQNDVDVATFVAIVALAKRLTGAELCISVLCGDGFVRSVTGNESTVTWLEPGQIREVPAERWEAARQGAGDAAALGYTVTREAVLDSLSVAKGRA